MMSVSGSRTCAADQLCDRIFKHERRLRVAQRVTIFEHSIARARRNRDVLVTDNSVGLDCSDSIAIDLDFLFQIHRDVRATIVEGDADDLADWNSRDFNRVADFEPGDIVEISVNYVSRGGRELHRR